MNNDLCKREYKVMAMKLWNCRQAGRCSSASGRAGISAFSEIASGNKSVQPTIQQEKHKKDTPPNFKPGTVWEKGVKNIAISCVFVVPVTILKRGWLVHQFEE
jgi:hypothetical protein